MHAVHLVDGGVDVVGREETGAQQPRARAAVVGHPVVVGTGDRGREPRFEPVGADVLGGVEPEDEEPTAREQHRDVDALLVHRRQLRRRVPQARLRRCQRLVRPGLPPDRLGEVRLRPAHAGEAVVLDPHPHVPVELAEPDRRRMPPLGGDVALPEVGRLHDVHVAVGDAPSVRAHRLLLGSNTPRELVADPHGRQDVTWPAVCRAR